MIAKTPPTNCALMSEETEPMIDVAGDWKQLLLKIWSQTSYFLEFQARFQALIFLKWDLSSVHSVLGYTNEYTHGQV